MENDEITFVFIVVFFIAFGGLLIGIPFSINDSVHGTATILHFQKYTGDTAPYRIVQTTRGDFTLSCDYFDNSTSLPIVQNGRFFWYLIPFGGRSAWQLDYTKMPRGC